MHSLEHVLDVISRHALDVRFARRVNETLPGQRLIGIEHCRELLFRLRLLRERHERDEILVKGDVPGVVPIDHFEDGSTLRRPGVRRSQLIFELLLRHAARRTRPEKLSIMAENLAARHVRLLVQLSELLLGEMHRWISARRFR